jgi:RNA polymerase sigma factor (sigma-70 family)
LDCFDEFTARFIGGKVKKLIGRAGLQESDREDLIQKFALDLLKRRKRFDPKKATWEGFVVVVCENRAAAIFKHQLAAMRSRKREDGSLNCRGRGANGCDMEAGAIPESQHCLRTCQRPRTHNDADIVYDVAEVLEQLPPQERALCHRLMKGSVSDVAQETGESRTKIYRRIGLIRERFKHLRVYL